MVGDMEKLDDLDRKILASLVENSKLMSKELSRKLRIHPNTLLQRLKKLNSDGVIKKYTVQIDYEKVDFDLHVIIMMKVKKGRAGDIDQLRDLLHVGEIEALYATTGVWDVIGTARVKNRQHLLKVVQKLGQCDIITKTASTIVLFTYKEPADFNPLAPYLF